MKKTRNILLVLLVIIIAGVLIYFIMNSENSESEEFLVEESQSEEVTSEVIDEKTQKINEILSEMTDSEKAGQLFLARVPEDYQIEDIQDYQLGGYLMFGKDFEGETIESLKSKTDSWQSVSKIPMLIASDEEGGTVTRISSILDQPFASPGELYSLGGLDLIYSDTLTKSSILKSAGINVNLAPVADVAVDPYSFIYDRTLTLPEDTSLEEAAIITAQYVQTSVAAMHEGGIGCSLKHFPGYGENPDTHTDIVTDSRELTQFETIDYIPFEAGIEAGAGSVLISHNIVIAIDPTQPASISPAVHDVLRNQLGFNGVILTDDLDMAGLADFIDQESAALQTINAGTDLIISSSYSSQIDSLLKGLEEGTLSRERFEEAVSHVLSWKYDLNLFN